MLKNTMELETNTSLAAPGHSLTTCNALPPATTHRLQNSKWLLEGPKMADGVWKGVYL